MLYANGTRLNYQNRKTEKDNIQILVTLKGDFAEFSPRYASVVEQASSFSRADIKGVTKSEMDRQFVGQKTNFAVRMSGKNLNISASTRSADLEDTLSIITSFITDFDIKSNQRKQNFDRNIINIKTATKNSPALAGAVKIPYAYSGKASSFLSKSGGKYSSDKKTLNSIKSIIDTGLIEVGVVGDFDFQILKNLFSSSLGAIPPRNKVGRATEKLDVITHIKPGVTNITYAGDSKQMASFYCWPLNSNENPEKEVIETLSAQVINNRIIQRFREELGVTYSPRTISQKNQAFPDFEYTCFSLQFSPEDEAVVHENFMDVLDELSIKPITKIELKRAREPIISLVNRFGNSNLALSPIIASAYSEPNLLKAHREYIPLLKKARLKSISKHITEGHHIDDAHIFRIHSSSLSLNMKRKALELEVQIGRAEAQYALGNLLKQNLEEGDDARAISLLKKAASQNHKKAHFKLGRHYALARENLEIAANHLKLSEDSKEGAFLLAEIYFRNPDLFPDISEPQIMELYRLSSENGYAYAQRELAQRYKDGSIIDRDEVEALKWIIISARLRGGAMADLKTKLIQRFEANLSQIDKDRARKEAIDWTEAYWKRPLNPRSLKSRKERQ